MVSQAGRTSYWTALTLATTTALFVSQTNDFLLVRELQAQPADVGLANALEMAGYLFLSIPFGHLIARWRSSSVLAGSAALTSVLIAFLLWFAVTGGLSIQIIWAVSAVAGIGAVAQGIASSSLVGRLFEDGKIPRIASRSSAIRQSCGAVIPAVAGIVLQSAGARPLLLSGVICAVGAAAAAWGLRRHEAKPAVTRAPGAAPTEEDGTRPKDTRVWGPSLAVVSGLLLLNNFGLAFASSVTTIYLNRDLGLDFGVIGLAVSAGAVGGVLGAVLAEPAIERLGFSRIRVLTPLVLAAAVTALWAVMWAPDLAVGVVLSQEFVYGLAMSVFNVALFSWVSAAWSREVLPRVHGVLQTVGMGSVPAGALLGGLSGSTLGSHATIFLWILILAALPPLALILKVRPA